MNKNQVGEWHVLPIIPLAPTDDSVRDSRIDITGEKRQIGEKGTSKPNENVEGNDIHIVNVLMSNIKYHTSHPDTLTLQLYTHSTISVL